MDRWQLIQSALLSQDEDVRLRGLQCLYHWDGVERLDIICKSLGDSSWRVRKEAVALFLSLADAAAHVERIVALLYDEENAGLRNAAAEVLVRLASTALPALLGSAGSPDPDVRKFVLDILGDIGDRRATPLLLNALQGDRETNVRAAAAENLGKLGDAAAVTEMLDALLRPDLLVQFSLLEALGRIGCPVPLEKLQGVFEDKRLRRPLFDALGHIGDEKAVAVLMEGLHDPMRNIRESAIVALERLSSRYGAEIVAGEMRGADFSSVTALLASPSLPVQRAALAIASGECDQDRALLLAQYLDDDRLADQVATILACQGRAVIDSLLTCWAGASQRKRAYLAYLFGVARVESAAPLLAQELGTADEVLRIVLLRALGQVGGASEIVTLAGYLADPEDDLRQAAIDALVAAANHNLSLVVDQLRAFSLHALPSARQAAIQLYGCLGGEESAGALLRAMKDDSALVRRTAISYLDSRNPQHAALLTLALTDEEAEVRCLAIDVLSRNGDRHCLEPISLLLQDDDPWVRVTVIRALGRLGGGEALAAILSGLRDPVGLVAIATLETLREGAIPFDLGVISEHLGHDDDDVVLALVRFLATNPGRDWLVRWGEPLLNHRHAPVRQVLAELLAEEGRAASRLLLQQRLLVEGDDDVRTVLRQALAVFSVHQESP